MIKRLLAVFILVAVNASAQWLGHARQTRVFTTNFINVPSANSNVQQALEWMDDAWPTNIALTNVYPNQGSLYYTNFNTLTNAVTVSNSLAAAIVAATNLTVSLNSAATSSIVSYGAYTTNSIVSLSNNLTVALKGFGLSFTNQFGEYQVQATNQIVSAGVSLTNQIVALSNHINLASVAASNGVNSLSNNVIALSNGFSTLKSAYETNFTGDQAKFLSLSNEITAITASIAAVEADVVVGAVPASVIPSIVTSNAYSLTNVFVNGTLAGRVRFTNNVWTVYGPNHYFESIRSTAASSSGPSNVWNTITSYDTIASGGTITPGSYFSPTTGKYTAPSNGVYLFAGTLVNALGASVTNVGFKCAFSVNGSTNIETVALTGTMVGENFGTTRRSFNGSLITTLLKDDEVTLMFYSSLDLATNNIINSVRFSGIMLQSNDSGVIN